MIKSNENDEFKKGLEAMLARGPASRPTHAGVPTSMLRPAKTTDFAMIGEDDELDPDAEYMKRCQRKLTFEKKRKPTVSKFNADNFDF